MNQQRYVMGTKAIGREVIAYIQSLFDAGTEQPKAVLEVIIRPYKAKRSLAQNACFHAWMGELSRLYSEHYGEEKAPWVWKEFFKRQFIGEAVEEVMGQVITCTRSTTTLSVNEFAEFLTRIDVWVLQELGLMLSRNRDYFEAMGI